LGAGISCGWEWKHWYWGTHSVELAEATLDLCIQGGRWHTKPHGYWWENVKTVDFSVTAQIWLGIRVDGTTVAGVTGTLIGELWFSPQVIWGRRHVRLRTVVSASVGLWFASWTISNENYIPWNDWADV